MDQDERYQNLDQRLVALEAKMETLSQLTTDLATWSQRLERLANLEALIDRLQDNFLMISDMDTFTHLRDLLVEGQFKAADQETASVLFGMINKTADTITPDDIETFPIAPLRIVDRLWRRYSQDRFGFSIQLKAYRALGGSLNTLIAQDEELFLAFCDQIGWRQNGKFILRDNWEASLTSPEGFLPMKWWGTSYGLKTCNFVLARLIKGGF